MYVCMQQQQCMYVCMDQQQCMYVCMDQQQCMYVCMYVCMYAIVKCMYVWISSSVCMYQYQQQCMYVCMCQNDPSPLLHYLLRLSNVLTNYYHRHHPIASYAQLRLGQVSCKSIYYVLCRYKTLKPFAHHMHASSCRGLYMYVYVPSKPSQAYIYIYVHVCTHA